MIVKKNIKKLIINNAKIGKNCAQDIAKILNKELKYKMVDFHAARPGHDLRYGLDGSKLLDMGWILPIDFYESLRKTILWTLDNQEWLDE